MTTRNPQPTAVSNTLSSLVPHPALWRHGVLGVLFFWIAVSAIADSYAPNWEDPAFINNITIVLAPRTDGREGLGTSDEPLNASGERFDRIMQQFRRVPGITFLLRQGEYETMAKPEQGDPGTPNNRYWEPYNYWKILGAGTSLTFIRQIGVETAKNTKHSMVYCSRPEPALLRHFELGHLTLDAQGLRLAPAHSSNFGCISLDASDVRIHDIVCRGAINALADDGVKQDVEDFRELFILRIGVPTTGPSPVIVSNNIIERCTVLNSPDTFLKISTNKAGDVIIPIVTGIMNGGQAPSYSRSPRILDCVVEGINTTQRFNSISLQGCIGGVAERNTVRNAQFGFYRDTSPTESIRVISNAFINVARGVYLNSSSNQGLENRDPVQDLGIWGNRVLLSGVTLGDVRKSTAVGIEVSGNTNPNISSFSRVTVGFNSVGRYDTSGNLPDQQFYAINLAYVNSSWIFSNRMDFSASAPEPILLTSPRRPPIACGNRNRDGTPVSVVSDTTVVPESCSRPPEFTSALQPYPTLVTSRGPNPVIAYGLDAAAPGVRTTKPVIVRDTARDLEQGLLNPIKPEAERGFLEQESGEFGSASFRFDTQTWPQGPYYVWFRVQASEGSNRLCWVELDHEVQLFDSYPESSFQPSGWYWAVLRGRPYKEAHNSNPIRLWDLTPGVHEMNFHWDGPHNLRIDHVIFTPSDPQRFTPNDVIARIQPRSMAVQFQEAWSLTLPAVGGSVQPPLQQYLDATPHGEACVETLTIGQGAVELRFKAPRSGYYDLAFRVKRRAATLTEIPSCYVAIDGVESVMLPVDQGTNWHWTTRIDRTMKEAAATSAEHQWTRYLTAGPHTLRVRARVPGMLISEVRISDTP